MRLLLALTLCACFTGLSAQSKNGISKWVVSLNVSPDFSSYLNVAGLRIEVDPLNIPSGSRADLDTINVFGEQRFFQFSPAYIYPISPSDASFRFGSQLRLHRRIGKNFNVAMGLHYSRAKYTTLNKEPERALSSGSNGPTFVLYPVAKEAYSNVGIVTHFEYHIWPDNRFHPYFGLGISTLTSSHQRTLLGQIYTGHPDQLLSLPEPLTTNSTVFDLDLTANAGLLYRVLPHWQVGVTANSRVGVGSGIFGAQLRYSL